MILPADAPTRRPPAADAPAADTPPAPLADRVRAALDAPRLTREDLAARLGIPRGRLESYQYGARRMPDDVRRRLAVVLAAHADELRRVAAALLAPDAPDPATPDAGEPWDPAP